MFDKTKDIPFSPIKQIQAEVQERRVVREEFERILRTRLDSQSLAFLASLKRTGLSEIKP